MLNNVERGALNNAERHYVPLLLPIILERSGAVEHEFLARSIRIHYEVTMLEELVVLALSNAVHHLWCVHFGFQRALNLAVHYLQALWVQQVAEVAFLCRWVLACEQSVVQTHLCIHA